MLWHELVTNIAHETGGEHTRHPFSRDSVLPILNDRCFVDGAGALATLWLSQEWSTIKAYVRAVKDRYPAVAKPKRRSDDPAGDIFTKIRAQLKGRKDRRLVLRHVARHCLAELRIEDIAEALAAVTDDHDTLTQITTRAEELRARREAVNSQLLATVHKIAR